MKHAIMAVLASGTATLLELPGPVGAYLNLDRVTRREIKAHLAEMLMEGTAVFNEYTQAYCLTEEGASQYRQGR